MAEQERSVSLSGGSVFEAQRARRTKESGGQRDVGGAVGETVLVGKRCAPVHLSASALPGITVFRHALCERSALREVRGRLLRDD